MDVNFIGLSHFKYTKSYEFFSTYAKLYGRKSIIFKKIGFFSRIVYEMRNTTWGIAV